MAHAPKGARRVHPRARTAGGGDRASLRSEAHRQEQRSRLRLRHHRAPWRRRLYLRRGDGAAREPGRQEGNAAAQAAVPGQFGSVRLPDHGQQCRDHRAGARHHAPRRRLVRRHRPAQQHRHQAFLHFRPCRAAVQCRGGDGHSAARAYRQTCWRRARRLGQSACRDPRAARQCRWCRPAPTRPTRC